MESARKEVEYQAWKPDWKAGELLCLYLGCPRSLKGHGFKGERRLAERDAHVMLCLWDPINFCQCVVWTIEQAITNYCRGLVEGIEQSIVEAMIQEKVAFADPDHSECDICKKPVSTDTLAHESRVRARIRRALADQPGRECAPAYTHKPLDLNKQQIRLVSLSAATNEYVLENFDWEEAPPFIAVSYTWGPSTPSHYINLNGQLFQVRNNLHEFLETLAKRNATGKWLWIDQICIDQSNINERNHQVPMMSRIYSRCKGVVIWLGSDPDLQRAVEHLIWHCDFDALADILQSPYFLRLWIIQEILVNPTTPFILCGDTNLPWRHLTFFTTISGWIEEMLQRAVPASSIYLLAEAVGRKRNQKRALTTCIYYYSANLCQNPRDKVYGLLALIDETYRPVVDYNKSVEDVFCDAVIAMVRAPIDPTPLERDEDNSTVSAIWHLGRMIGLASKDLPTRRFIVELEKTTKKGITLDNGVYNAGLVTAIGSVQYNRLSYANRYGKFYGWWFEYTGKQKKWRVYNNERGRHYHTVAPAKSST
jgi:hypothetical protein